MDNEEIFRLCRAASKSGMTWDYFVDDQIPSPVLQETVSGVIVLALERGIRDVHRRRKTIALFVAYAARQSLACWFAYCEDDKPYRTIRKVIDQILSPDYPPTCSIDEGDLVACRPMENGRPIIDCRAEDTLSASEAVAHATRYLVGGSDEDAASALSDAFSAFNVSPVDSISSYLDWLFDVALPAALDLRYLPPDDSLADDAREWP